MSKLNLSLARKVMQVANGGSQLAEIENFNMKLNRDGVAFVIGQKPSEIEGQPSTPITEFQQKNLHFKKMRNFTDQVNSLTTGYDHCEIVAGEYKVKFRGGKFAINAERLLKEITENYFRTTQQVAIVDNESVEFDETREKFVNVFIGDQTSMLNYLALIDTFKTATNSELFALSSHMKFTEDGQLQFSELLLQNAEVKQIEGGDGATDNENNPAE